MSKWIQLQYSFVFEKFRLKWNFFWNLVENLIFLLKFIEIVKIRSN